MKKMFKITFFVSLALVILLAAGIIASAISAVDSHSTGMGIIGGADGPTAVLVTRTTVFGSPLFWLLCVALVLLVSSAFGWIATKKK